MRYACCCVYIHVISLITGNRNDRPAKQAALRKDSMRKTAIVSILILCAGLFSASAQSAPAQDGETRLLTDSLGPMAPRATQLTRAPAVVRKDLTESERQAPLDISISLKMRNFAELQQRIANGEIIPAEEMETRYYPTAADCQMVVNWLTEKGLQVQPQSKYSVSIFARGSIAQLETAFGTRFARVQFDGDEASSAVVPPTLPAAIATRVLGINGLQPHLRPRRHSKVMPASPQKLINNVPPYTVKEISNAYNASGLGVTGAGQKIGIVIDTFPSASDLLQFWQGNAITQQSLNNIEEVQVVAGSLPSPSGEETLDVEWTSGMAPGAKVRVYAATDLAFVHLDQTYQAILNDLPSQPQLHEVSLSYGLGELYMSTAQMQTDAQYFASLAASGVTIFVATGDGGSSPGEGGFADNSGPVQVESPANDPSVTAVGGTSLHLNSTTGAVTSESAWFYGGGGVSTFFPRPSWQTGAGLPAGNFRTVPDVASVADLNTGGYLIFGGQLQTVGGTSWGAPVWAGLCAMINQARANFSEGPVGLLGPKIYILNGSSSFRDITTGSNGPRVYNAGPFYDLCTGLGVANLSSLGQALSAVPTSHPFTSSFLSYSGDFNGDGKQDILWRDTQTGDVDVWFMNGTTVVSQAHIGTAGLDWKIMGTADFNGDGKSDILWENSTNGSFVIWVMQGSSHSDYEFTSPGSQWSIAGVADLDHSGFADILWRNTSTGDLMAWKSSPGLNFTSFSIGTASLDWNLVGAADLLGNGQSALIWRNQNSGEVEAWQLNGGAIAAQSSLGVVSLNWTIAGFGNFNGNGHQDILWHSTSDGSVAAWYMNGFSVSPGWVNQRSIPQEWQIRATPDVIGNGLNGILWSDTNTGEQVLWIPGGAGFSQTNIGFAGSPWAVQR
jgi:kumamolisin